MRNEKPNKQTQVEKVNEKVEKKKENEVTKKTDDIETYMLLMH
jgi:hypothetical protein